MEEVLAKAEVCGGVRVEPLALAPRAFPKCLRRNLQSQASRGIVSRALSAEGCSGGSAERGVAGGSRDECAL